MRQTCPSEGVPAARTRKQWRERVVAHLTTIGATFSQTPSGVWKISRGTAYMMAQDLAHLSESDLQMLSRA